MNKTIDLSIVILNFNTRFLLSQCLFSVAAAVKDSYSVETIVVDNASTDGSVEEIQKLKGKIKNLKIIRNPVNLGFAAGNNVGIKEAKGRYILLLNSDTELSANSLTGMLDFMENHENAGAATCRLELTSGQLDPACHRGFPTPWAALTYFSGLEKLFPASRIFGGYHQGYKNFSKPHLIDCPSGAFFLVRREVADKVGLLDEDFFMYGEDLDWAYRMKGQGFSIWFNPAVTVLHRKKQSGRENADPEIRNRTRKYFFETMKLFYRKHYAKKYGWFITGLILWGIKLRSLI